MDAKAAHETIWAHGGTAGTGERNGTQPGGGRSPGLALVMLWALLQCGSW